MDDREGKVPEAEAELVALRARAAALEQELAAERRHRIYSEQLLANVNDAIIVLDLDFHIQAWNAGAERIYGWAERDVRGKQLSALLQQRYLGSTFTSARAFGDLLARGSWAGIVAQRHRDGHELIVDSAVRALRDAQGALTGLIGINRDVTDRYQALAALSRSDATLRAFFDSSPQALYLIDPEYRILAFNRITARDIQQLWQRDIAVGDLVFDFIPPSSVERFTAHFQRCLRGESIYYESQIFHPSGLERWYGLSYIPISQPDGEIVGVAFGGLDITESKLADLALRSAETRYRTLVEQIPAVTYIVEFGDANRTAYVSPQIEGLLGYTAEEWLGDPALWFGRIFPADREASKPFFRAGSDDSRALDIEYRMLTRDGRTVWVHNTASPIIAVPGQTPFSIGILFDITARKQSEEEKTQFDAKLQQTQKLESLGMLAGGIAHDFNNLLTSILGYADLALLELPPRSPARPLISEAVNGARRAAELTAQMLAYSGKGRFVVEQIDLSRLIEDITRLLEISISKKCVIKYNLMQGLPSVAADATQMRQVIMNLMINASEAIGDRSGVITITTGAMYCDSAYLSETYLDENLPEGLYVYLEVADNGTGMSEAVRARVFEPFFTTKFTGRGLGLAAVLGIVRGHRGALKIYSEQDVGSTFKALFPATDLPASLEEALQTPALEWRGSGTVLVIDDEETARGLARHMFERMGFEVLSASDGREGLELFRLNRERIRLVLLDMTMPHMDGEETFRELRRIQVAVRVILTSGYNEQTATSRFAGKGLAAFIQKPYRFEQLRSTVRNVLG